jgi:hypothetical protein
MRLQDNEGMNQRVQLEVDDPEESRSILHQFHNLQLGIIL